MENIENIMQIKFHYYNIYILLQIFDSFKFEHQKKKTI